jgi:hypothetical protein
MAVLEYLTQNSLTAYPFKKLNKAEADNIEVDWFYDILFISYSDIIKAVYISKIIKTNQNLTITFNNFLTEDEIITVIIPAIKVVNHFNNSLDSFYSYSNNLAAVKIILGQGIVNKSNFSNIYQKQNTELAASAIILNCPKLKTLTLKAYNTSFNSLNNSAEYTISEIKQYNYLTAVPVINLRYNLAAESVVENSINLDVGAGLGAGLYDNCPKSDEMYVYSLANVTPDAYGGLFIKATSCYAYNVLNAINGALIESLNPSPANVYEYSLDEPQHAIYFQNFCSPKCPRENITAFAHYLNRITDGAKELADTVANKKETRGYGSFSIDNNFIFTAASFIDNSFTRCNTHDTGGIDTYIGINDKFIKNFHEFKYIQIILPSAEIVEYQIIEVLSETQIRLNFPISIANTLLEFRILDNGVFSNMNCAIKNFNLKKAALQVPYTKIKYSSYETNQQDGKLVTYITINAAIFNPSTVTYSLRLLLNYTNLLTDGVYKITKGTNIYKTYTPTVSLNCKEYAFIEAVFYTYSSTDTGSISAELINNATGLPIGETYDVVSGVQANPGITYILSPVKNFRATQTNLQAFSTSLSIHPDIQAIAISGDVPIWLDYNYSVTNNILSLYTATEIQIPTESKRFTLKLTATATGIYSNYIETVILDYVATPKITSPLSNIFTSSNPKTISKAVTYTNQNPVISITALNMTSWVAQFPTDNVSFRYTVQETLPVGLSFNTSTGKLLGKITELAVDTIFSLTFKAVNPSGQSEGQTINFKVVD